jgi:predicted Co/Zn/Cd cation transporter (cation efflux family)
MTRWRSANTAVSSAHDRAVVVLGVGAVHCPVRRHSRRNESWVVRLSTYDWLIMAALLVALFGCILLLTFILDGGWEEDHGRNLWCGRERR